MSDDRGPYAPPPLPEGEHRAKWPTCAHTWFCTACLITHRCNLYRDHLAEFHQAKGGHRS